MKTGIAETDPHLLGWMQGFPPPDEKVIRFHDGSYFRFPQLRWTVSHMRQLMPTVNVARGLGQPAPLEKKLDGDIDQLRFRPIGIDASISWEESLSRNYTDAIIVLHEGVVVYERYFGVMTELRPHAAMSMTKSFVGTLAAMLVAGGELDERQLVKEYVPELASSAFGNATVRQLMDMTTGIRFSENYADPEAEVWAHARAGNPLPKPEGYQGPRSYYEFLQTIIPEGKHGEGFHYKTANTDALGWVISRVTGKSVADLLSERIWQKLGADLDAYMSVDSVGTPFSGGGLNLGLRDLAKFGEMMRSGGYYNNQQIVPESVVQEIRKGGSKKDFEKAGYALLGGWSYRNMWWVTNNEHGAFMARGVHGQSLYIDPKARMVIARFASHPKAANAENDPATLPAYHALASYLLGLQQ
ncbi:MULTISPECIES: serine hydrolase [Microbulbifer]|uniref:serine hydrolase domain-containing protein n=1 Tax=Microbulbifer TaxID=48073 RepID=UPI001E5D70D6|nr:MULTISPECIES: serine hydrolase [Microbulbifer]